MRTWRKLLCNERGVALPLAMICLVALTVMVLTFLTLSGVEPQISQSLTDTARARYLAESGIEWGFKQVAASPVGISGNFAASLLAGPDGVNNTADDLQPTNVPAQNTAAMLTALGSPSPLPTKTTAEGAFSVTVRNDNLANDDKFTGVTVDSGNKFTDNNGIIIVTSTGTFRGATRTIQVALKRVGLPPFPGAVNIPGFQADTFLSNSVNSGNANRYDIDGRDYDRNGSLNAANPTKLGVQVQPGIQTDLGITYEARAEQPFDNANVCSGADCSNPTKAANRTARLGIVKGKDQNPPGNYTTGLATIGPDASLNPTIMSGFLSQIASNPATAILQSTQACPIVMTGGAATATSTPTLTNGCSMNQTVSLGTTADPKMVYFRGDPDTSSAFAGLTVNNMVSGAGILIVEDGDLQQYGNLRWDGLVIVTGQYVSAAFRTGSNTTIYGALTGMESQPAESSGYFDFFMDTNLDFRVRSSKQNLDMVQQMLSVHKILSWREN
jgi:hypothetical protein